MKMHFRLVTFLSLVLFVLPMLGAALLQVPVRQPTMAILVVTKTDGTSVRGPLVLADPEKVVVRSKEGEATVFWKEIKSVSNGLTRAKATESFRKAHPDQLCPDCLGLATAQCPICKGTGHEVNAETDKDCPACKGELLVACKTANCKEGQIPCPRTCLKRSEGTWVTHDGKTVRLFGKASFSEAQVGELIVRENGVYVSQGACPTCGGKTTLSDPVCHGTSKVTCPVHLRAKTPACKECDKGKVACTLCGGSGLKNPTQPVTPPPPTPEAQTAAPPDPATPPPATPPAEPPASGTPSAMPPATPPASPPATTEPDAPPPPT